jgi:hypothetical protein
METFDPEAVLAQRKAELQKTLRRVDAGELRRFVDEIFINRQSHPWFKPFHDFLDQHPHDTFLRAEVGEGITVIYNPSAHAGMWCRMGETLEGVGLLHGRGLESVKTIADRFLADPS